MHRAIPYTPQELIIKDACMRLGVSFCLYKDSLITWGNGKGRNYKIQH